MSSSALEYDEVSFAATDTTEGSSFSGGEDFNAHFTLHRNYANRGRGEGGVVRREALAQGSAAWAMGMVSLTGKVREPHPDEHLDCADQKLPLKELKELCGDLGSDPDLRSIDLSGNYLGLLHEEGCPPPRPPDGHQYPNMTAMELVADAIRENTALTSVNLSRNMLGDLNQNSLTKIFDSLIHKQNMAILDVSANGILGPDGNRLKSIAHLCKVVMPTMPTLIHLDLSYNELHCEALKLLAHSVNIPSLISLNLSHNRVSEDPRGVYDASGIQVFCGQLQTNPSLTSIRLGDNRLSNDECREIAKSTSQMITIRSLDLSDNFIHAAGASALQDFFFSDEHLEYLDISGNPLADQGAHHIATLLQMNARIHSLSLARCSITEGVCKEFEIAMRNNTTLTSLNFSENDVRDMRIRYVLESTNSNVDLIHVRDHPLKYDFEAQSTVTKRQLISKIHHLDEPKLRLLVSNTSFMNDPNMKRRLLELVPPTRRKLVFSGQAMAKTAGADWRHVRAARFIQRRYREYKSGKSLKYSMADVVEAKVRAYKKQFYGTYGKQGWAKEKLRRAARKAAMVHKLGQVGEGAKGGDLAKAVVLRSSAQVAPS